MMFSMLSLPIKLDEASSLINMTSGDDRGGVFPGDDRPRGNVFPDDDRPRFTDDGAEGRGDVLDSKERFFWVTSLGNDFPDTLVLDRAISTIYLKSFFSNI